MKFAALLAGALTAHMAMAQETTCADCVGASKQWKLTYTADKSSAACATECTKSDAFETTVHCAAAAGDCDKLSADDKTEGDHPYSADSCELKECTDCVGAAACKAYSKGETEVCKPKDFWATVPEGATEVTDASKCSGTPPTPVGSSCDDCTTAGDKVFKVEYADKVKTTCAAKAECTAVLTQPTGIVECVDKTGCAKLNAAYSAGEGSFDYVEGSCFPMKCADCKTAKDSCKYYTLNKTMTADTKTNLTGCVPAGLISNDKMYEVEVCPANAAGGLLKAIAAGAGVAVAAAFAL